MLIDDTTEIKMIDDYKKEIITEDELTNVNYDLSKLEYVKDPKLSLKEIKNLAKINLKKLKNRTLILEIPLFIIIILVLLSIHSLIFASTVDVKHIAQSHSKVYNISLEKADTQVNHYDFKEGFQIFCQEFISNNENLEFVTTEKVKMKYTINSFSQMKENQYTVTGFSLLSLEHLSKDNLYYGRMPIDDREIVVEKWVLEKALEDSTLQNFLDVKSFLNENVKLGSVNFDFKIVGIADNDEHAIYINKWCMFDIIDTWFNVQKISIGSIQNLSKYVDVSSYNLQDNQCLWNVSKPSQAYNNKILINTALLFK